jgi:hypothetical protein
MSRIHLLNNTFSNLSEVLQPYEDDIQAVEDRIRVRGKTQGRANEEQAAWIAYYDERRAEVKALVKFIQLRVDATRGRLFRQYTENSSRELTERGKEKYIDHDPEYIAINEILIEVEEVLDKLTSIVDAFRTRGFALRNLTELTVHQITDAVI